MGLQCRSFCYAFFFFNDTATTEIYTLSLHDALPICPGVGVAFGHGRGALAREEGGHALAVDAVFFGQEDRKSTRLNSSHSQISYAVFCLKKKTQKTARL